MKNTILLSIAVALVLGANILAYSSNNDIPKYNQEAIFSERPLDESDRIPLSYDARQIVVDSIPAPGQWHMGLAWDGEHLYNYSNDTIPPTRLIYKIDPQAGTHYEIITTEITGRGLGLTYLNGSLWFVQTSPTHMVIEIDPNTGNTISSFPSPGPVYSSCHGITHDSTYLWLTNSYTDSAYQVTTSGTIVRSLDISNVLGHTMDITWNPQRGTIFVVNSVYDLIVEIDVSGDTAVLLSSFPHPDPLSVPEGITYDGEYIWTCSFYNNWIWKIDIGDPTPVGIWDFEDGIQGWTHTNGLPFPGGWNVEDANLHPNAQSPQSGDSSLWIDSDAYGSGTIDDTAWSPELVPSYSMDWLKWGLGFQSWAPENTLSLGIRQMVGGSWQNPTRLKWYTSGVGAGLWDSIDVSAYVNTEAFQIFFSYDNADSAGYVSLDNIGISASTAEHDVGCTQITSPPAGVWIPVYNYYVIGKVKNFGHYPESFNVTANVYETIPVWTLVFTETATINNLPAGAESLHWFSTVTFEQYQVYCTEIHTELVGDVNHTNDTCSIYSDTWTFNITWNFENGLAGWTHTNGQPFPRGWDIRSSNLHSPYVLPMSQNQTMWIDSDAAGSTCWVQDTALSPVVTPDSSTMWLRYGYCNVGGSGAYLNELHAGIKFHSAGVWNVTELASYPSGMLSGPAWDLHNIESQNTADSIQIYFYFDDLNTWGYYAAFDNVLIGGILGAEENPSQPELLKFGFTKNMVNPINNNPRISYVTTHAGNVSIKIYDCMGRLIKTLVDEVLEQPGEKYIHWNREDMNGRTVSKGIYLIELEATGRTDVHKLIVIE